MDEAAVTGKRRPTSVEPGEVIASKYTVLRRWLSGPPNLWLSRPLGPEPLAALHLMRPRHDVAALTAQFEHELPRLAALGHPALLPILDFGKDVEGWLYVAHEPLELPNLSQRLEHSWPLTESQVVQLMLQLLAALEAGHSAGFTHGDLRPENLLLRPGATPESDELLLCGLGLAKFAPYHFTNHGRPPMLKAPEWIVGTPTHAAPEQLRGEAHDARSDVYGAGLVLFQLLTRTAPFDAETPHETAFMQCFTPPPPPSGYTGVGSALEAVCLKALSKTPEIRYQSAGEMREALLATQAKATGRQSRRPSVAPDAKRASVLPDAKRTSSVPEARGSQSHALSVALVVPGHPEVLPARLTHPESFGPLGAQVAPVAPPRRGGRGLVLMALGCVVGALVVSALPRLGWLDTSEDGSDESESWDSEPEPSAEDVAAAPALPERPALAATKPVSAPAPTAPLPGAPVPSVIPSALDGASLAPAAVPAAPATASAPAPLSAPAPAAPTLVAPAQPIVAAPRVRVRTTERAVLLADQQTTVAQPASAALNIVVQPALQAAPTAPAVEPSVATAEAGTSALPAPIALPASADAVLTNVHRPAPSPDAIAPPKPLPAPPIAPVSVEKPRVAIGDATTTHGAVSRASLRGALNQAAITRCYRDAMGTGQASRLPLHAQLDIETRSGRITTAKLRGPELPKGLIRCVEDAARLGRVREADTGDVKAQFAVSFMPQ
jgi:serine/threonine-protein kinase